MTFKAVDRYHPSVLPDTHAEREREREREGESKRERERPGGLLTPDCHADYCSTDRHPADPERAIDFEYFTRLPGEFGPSHRMKVTVTCPPRGTNF